MRLSRPMLFGVVVLSMLAFMGWQAAAPPQSAAAPQSAGQAQTQAPGQASATSQTPAGNLPVIKKEAKMVLVDAVVTDKKGEYIRDLKAKDFKVYEDNKEQPVTSFSNASEANSPNGPASTRYLVLFFDDSTMDPGDQVRARQAAAKFIDSTASSDRQMAVVDYGGAVHVAQNFTANTDRLKQVVMNVKTSAVHPNEQLEQPQLASAATAQGQFNSFGPVSVYGAEADFGARSMLLAVRSLVKNLRTVPGRKTLILFSEGFPLTSDRQSELTATIDAANKANVAIYPLDVRGLVAPGGDASSPAKPFSRFEPGLDWEPGSRAQELDSASSYGRLVLASFSLDAAEPDPQRTGGGGGGTGGGGGRGGGGAGGPGGGTGGGGRGGPGGSPGGSPGGKGASPGGNPGGHPGGSPGGSRGGGGGTVPVNRFTTQPYNDPRQIVPQIPETTATNQQVLWALANGTGGFPIFNTNDFLAGLDKIAKDLNEYYLLGYAPPQSED